MKRIDRMLFIFFAILLFRSANIKAEIRPGYNTSSGFFVKNCRLYDKRGNDFIIRGINASWAWNFNNNKGATDNMKHFGFNTVRIVWETGLSASNLDIAIETVVDNNMIPMVEIHDFTGSDSYNDLQTAAQWWANNKWVINRWEDYILLNIANEWSSGITATGYKNAYVAAIETIRNSGIEATLVIDARHYGKDQYTIRDVVDDIFNADPQKNIVFSQHMYCGSGSNGVWGVGENPVLIERDLNWWKDNGYCAIVGEFADRELYGGNCDVKEADIRRICQDNGQGYMWWSWDGAKSDGTWYYCIGNNNNWEAWDDNELSPWGYEMIVSDTISGIRATSVECSVFEDTINIAASGIYLNQTSANIIIGETKQLFGMVSPGNASIKNVTWSSDSTAIATVDSTGMVIGVAVGTAIITGTTEDGNYSATCDIKVSSINYITIPAKIEAEDYAYMDGIQTETTSDTGGGLNIGWVDEGDWMDFPIHVGSTGEYMVSLRVASTNSGRQLQLKSGGDILSTITAPNTGDWQNWKTISTPVNLSAGNQLLRILALTGSGWNMNWFEIKNIVAVAGVNINPTNVSIIVDETIELTEIVLPSEASNINVTWSSNNTSVATVNSSGAVTGLAEGSAAITVTTEEGGYSAICDITVISDSLTTHVFNLDKLDANNIVCSIYPNPAFNSMTIQLPTDVGSFYFAIFDITGILVKEQLVTNNIVTVDLNDTIPGIYLIDIIVDNNTTINKKLIIR